MNRLVASMFVLQTSGFIAVVNPLAAIPVATVGVVLGAPVVLEMWTDEKNGGPRRHH